MAFRDVLRGIGDVILNNKLITFLSVALFAFIIATIALASENNSNADALADCRSQLWVATSVAPPATTTLETPTSTTTNVDTTTTTAEAITTTTEVTTTVSETPAPEGQGRMEKLVLITDPRQGARRRR